MKVIRFIAALATLGLLAFTAQASSYEHSVPAVQGYDVVSYQTGKRPLRGNGNHVVEHNGATYLFSSAENQKLFEQDPDKFTPAYNGYCAFGASVGKKFIGDPEVWRLIDGKLYLNLDTGIQSEWLKDVPARIKAANKNWKKIKNRHPSTL